MGNFIVGLNKLVCWGVIYGVSCKGGWEKWLLFLVRISVVNSFFFIEEGNEYWGINGSFWCVGKFW